MLNILYVITLLQQWRLFPYLAASFAIKNFSDDLCKKFGEFQLKIVTNENKDEAVSFKCLSTSRLLFIKLVYTFFFNVHPKLSELKTKLD